MEKQIFAEFFKNQWESRPSVRVAAQRGFRGYMEEVRAHEFQSTDYQINPWTGPLWSQLSGSIYAMVARYYSVVLATFEDKTILWLDDHSSNVDFAEFVRREQLMNWLPDQMDDVLEILIKTKFNFLGWPKLVNSILDIPNIPVYKEYPEVNRGHSQDMQDAEMRLTNIADRLYPPTVTEIRKNEFELRFCIWTKLFGQVIDISCFLGGSDVFKYEGNQLVHLVGFYVVPR